MLLSKQTELEMCIDQTNEQKVGSPAFLIHWNYLIETFFFLFKSHSEKLKKQQKLVKHWSTNIPLN